MRYLVLLVAFTSLAAAQETCESLLQGLQTTLAETTTLTRATEAKAGFLTLMSNTTRVDLEGDTLVFTILEQEGRAPAGQANRQDLPEEDWLGPVDVDGLNCENHALEANGDSYEVAFADTDGAQLRDLVLHFTTDDYRIELLEAEVSPAGAPFAAQLRTTFSEWQLADNTNR